MHVLHALFLNFFFFFLPSLSVHLCAARACVYTCVCACVVLEIKAILPQICLVGKVMGLTVTTVSLADDRVSGKTNTLTYVFQGEPLH